MKAQVIAEGYLVTYHLGKQVWMVGPTFVVQLSSSLLGDGGGNEGVQLLTDGVWRDSTHPTATYFRMCVNTESWVRWILELIQ